MAISDEPTRRGGNTASAMNLPSNSGRPVSRLSTLLLGLLFVVGFTTVFVVGWGGAATFVGSLFSQYKSVLGRVGGAVVITFGLANLGVLRLPWLYVDTRRQTMPASPYRSLNAFALGMVFAAGWTPCIGTTLGAILTLGMTQSSQSMLLSAVYSAGLGLPFLLMAIVLDRAVAIARRLGRYARAIQIGSGLVLVLVGVLMVTDRLTLIAIWAQRNGYFLDLRLGSASAPTMAAALFAGLASFLSPCVLPLVPAYLGYLSGERVTHPA